MPLEHNTEAAIMASVEENVELETVRLELAELQAQYDKELYRYTAEMNELRNQNEIIKVQLSVLGQDVDAKALHEYASMINKVAPENKGSAYVVQLQSQLCKALHQVGVWSSQMGLLKNSYKNIVKSMQEELIEMQDAKCDAERDAERKVILAERKLRRLKDGYEKMVREQAQTIDDLQTQLETKRKLPNQVNSNQTLLDSLEAATKMSLNEEYDFVPDTGTSQYDLRARLRFCNDSTKKRPSDTLKQMSDDFTKWTSQWKGSGGGGSFDGTPLRAISLLGPPPEKKDEKQVEARTA